MFDDEKAHDRRIVTFIDFGQNRRKKIITWLDRSTVQERRFSGRIREINWHDETLVSPMNNPV